MTTYRLESDLSRDVIDFLNGVPECWAYVTHGGPYQRAGIPDVVGVYKGRMYGIELKMPSKYPSPLQRKTLRDICAAGGIGFVAWSLDAVREMIRMIDDEIAPEGT
jgi:hypothetical protein